MSWATESWVPRAVLGIWWTDNNKYRLNEWTNEDASSLLAYLWWIECQWFTVTFLCLTEVLLCCLGLIKDRAPEGKWVSALHPGWNGKERGIYPAINVKLCFLKKSCVTQSMNLGWICEYQNKETTCVETSMPVILTTFRCVLILFLVLTSEDRAEATYIWNQHEFWGSNGVSNTAGGQTSCRGSATYQGKAYIYFCLCLYWDFLPLCYF